MEDEPELLDWGHEDDELQMSSESYRKAIDLRRGGEADDAEDTVSLGGDEDEDVQGFVYQTRVQDDNSKALFSTPKSSTFHQPQRSSREPPSSSPQKPTHALDSPQHSPLRSSSPSKVTHALPPKPVVASVPFLHPSHPSIIEATAMSRGRPDRDKKLNGSVAKPVSSSDSDPLPPDWEVRHPRSGNRGVYYYNTRTHESTWTPPVSTIKSSSFSRDKDQGKTHLPESHSGSKHVFDSSGTKGAQQSTFSRPNRPEVESHSPANLSYEDRHYRPEADNSHKPSQEANRRDERPPSQDTPSGNSFTPPASPKPEPARSPWLRDRERQGRHQPSYRLSSPRQTSGNDAQPRESQRDGLSLPDRHWSSSYDPPSEVTSRRKPVSSTNYQQEDIGVEEPKTSAFEDPRNDAVWSSTSRHRSPPPHFRTPRPSQTTQIIASDPATTATTSRQKTRFDQPEKSSQSSLRSQEHDAYTTNMFWQRDQPPGTTSEQSVESAAKGMRPDDSATNVISNYRTSLAGPPHPAISHSERSVSVSPLSVPPQSDQSRSRKRQPLTPQSTRFRERPMTSQSEQVLSTVTAPVVHRDGGINTQRSSYVGSVPSGPRLQPQFSGTRDHNHPDLQASRPLSTTSVPRARHSRDMPFTPNEFPALRDRDVMDVDTLPSSRIPFGSNDFPIRAGSGMYADREQNTDLPKGPRAMSSKSSMAMHPPSPVSPSVPHPTFFTQRAVSAQDRSVNRLRDRSPHLEKSERWEQHRDAPEKQPRSDGSTAREDALAWRSGNQSVEDSSGRRELHQRDVDQAHRESFMNPNRRTTEFLSFPPNPQPKAPGTHNVPVGNRKVHHAATSLQPEIPSPAFRDNRHPPGAGTSEPFRDRVSRIDTQSRELYEHSSQVRTSPVGSYRPTVTNSGQHRRAGGGNTHAGFDGHPVTPSNTYHINSTPVRSRWELARADVEPPRFEQPTTAQENTRRAPSRWTPQQSSPGPPAIRTGFGGESDYRPVSPPSRELSTVSPAWDASFGTMNRPAGRHHDNARQYENTSRQAIIDGDSHRRRQPVPSADRNKDRFTDQRINNVTIGLESRLGERYDDRYPDVPFRPHALPANPSLHHDHDSYAGNPPHQIADHHNQPHSLGAGHHNTGWIEQGRPEDPSTIPASEPYPDRFRAFDGQSLTPPQDAIPSRTSKPNRVRRFGPPTQSRSDVIHPEVAVDMMSSGSGRGVEREGDGELQQSRSHHDHDHDHDRPNTLRRGGSLLDRLSFDNSATSVSVAMASTSLRERVLIPSKRDHDDMMNSADSPSIDASFDVDDGAGGDSRRNRRRNGKPRRGKGRNGVS